MHRDFLVFSYTLWRLSRWFQRPVAGLIGCLDLALALAPQEIAMGLVILLAGVLFRGLRVAVVERQKKVRALLHFEVRRARLWFLESKEFLLTAQKW
jgi:hypothetical protein